MDELQELKDLIKEQGKRELLGELRESFEERYRRAEHHKDRSESFAEYWSGNAAALSVSLAKLDAIEEELNRD